MYPSERLKFKGEKPSKYKDLANMWNNGYLHTLVRSINLYNRIGKLLASTNTEHTHTSSPRNSVITFTHNRNACICSPKNKN